VRHFWRDFKLFHWIWRTLNFFYFKSDYFIIQLIYHQLLCKIQQNMLHFASHFDKNSEHFHYLLPFCFTFNAIQSEKHLTTATYIQHSNNAACIYFIVPPSEKGTENFFSFNFSSQHKWSSNKLNYECGSEKFSAIFWLRKKSSPWCLWWGVAECVLWDLWIGWFLLWNFVDGF